ncbi:MAG: nitronate monooxygenase [Bacteroidia bacterium]|nr:nitronate monooxygenase [Bacteroidia bacterium]NNC86130.1 nitronate monooxygenase [Bacteroidia bacterium]
MSNINNPFTSAFGLNYPIIMAPMFLVSNENMVKEAIRCGIMGTFPTLNYRKNEELEKVLKNLQEFKEANPQFKGSYGVNIIVQKSNPKVESHLKLCVKYKVPFYITSLGNPKQVIEQAKTYGAKVYSDVTNVEHAKKADSVGCDGFIAVGQGAGGHAGPYPLSVLIPSLKKNFPNKPIIAAGGIAHGSSILSMLSLGGAGCSIGTRFIASTEATVSDDYKNAIVEYDMKDIVLTDKISGTPCTIINTPYAKKVGYKQNWFERLLSNNSTTKKYFKMLVQLRGMKKFEQALKPGTYKTLWCAGQSVELIDEIKSTEEIINQLVFEMDAGKQTLDLQFV